VRRTKDKKRVMQTFSLTPRQFNRMVHRLKAGVEGNPDLSWDLDTGDVFVEGSEDSIGSVYDPEWS
jgi:hypothetical protein